MWWRWLLLIAAFLVWAVAASVISTSWAGVLWAVVQLYALAAGAYLLGLPVRVEWKLPDLWVGVFWRTQGVYVDGKMTLPRTLVDVWICPVPCLPIHVQVLW